MTFGLTGAGWAGGLRAFRSCIRVVVVEVLQPGFCANLGTMSRIPHALRPHAHDAAGQLDAAMDGAGLRALWVSAAALAATAA